MTTAKSLLCLSTVLLTCPSPAAARIKSSKRDVCVGVPSITRHEVQMVMRANAGRLRQCYKKAPKHQPLPKKSPMARFSITQSGATADVRVEGFHHSFLRKCFVDAVRGIRFPPLRYKLKQQVKINYPLSIYRPSPDGRMPPQKVVFSNGARLELKDANRVVTVKLPAKARAALTSLRGHRLPTARDLQPRARVSSGFPYPFAVAVNLDRKDGDDLAIALVNRKAPTRWSLVVLHHSAGGYRLVKVARFDKIRRRFPKKATFSITKASRCFCDRRCIAVASNAGKSLEYEWDGKRYVGKLEHYLAPPAP